jgi:hypothetical protein
MTRADVETRNELYHDAVSDQYVSLGQFKAFTDKEVTVDDIDSDDDDIYLYTDGPPIPEVHYDPHHSQETDQQLTYSINQMIKKGLYDELVCVSNIQTYPSTDITYIDIAATLSPTKTTNDTYTYSNDCLYVNDGISEGLNEFILRANPMMKIIDSDEELVVKSNEIYTSTYKDDTTTLSPSFQIYTYYSYRS